jgi:hypothetical protein
MVVNCELTQLRLDIPPDVDHLLRLERSRRNAPSVRVHRQSDYRPLMSLRPRPFEDLDDPPTAQFPDHDFTVLTPADYPCLLLRDGSTTDPIRIRIRVHIRVRVRVRVHIRVRVHVHRSVFAFVFLRSAFHGTIRVCVLDHIGSIENETTAGRGGDRFRSSEHRCRTGMPFGDVSRVTQRLEDFASVDVVDP